jgi:glyoxylase-like metal-dependent hydrolase (beta-lactamase superfamily II)
VNDRRQFFKGAAGALALWASPRLLAAQTAPGSARLLADKLYVVDAGDANLVALSTGDGIVLVDSGAPQSSSQVTAGLRNIAAGAKVLTLFNTHYHLDQTGNNETFAAAGAKIIAHARTRQWMSADYWVPEEDRYEKARPKAARPTQTFQTTGSLRAGGEQIDYGYLPMAHTNGDIYVFFKTSNVVAVGEVASPVRDPALDYFAGGWIGGRVDAMDIILGLANEQTKIVPAYGPVMTRAEFKAERDLMEEVRARLWTQVREGKGPKDMLESGLLKGLSRTWKDPSKFLYDAAKGLWAHHNKLDRNVV